MNFSGKGLPLDEIALNDATLLLCVDAASLWSVISVETSGIGFLPDRRPKILFERHIFSSQTGGKHDAQYPEISNSHTGGYGKTGAEEYARLEKAMALDPHAALMSASWGLGQIMGFNFKAAGFGSVEEMVSAMTASEGKQLNAMAKFMIKTGLFEPLQQKNWAKFAEKYNGPGYAKNRYDEKLAEFYEKYSKGDLPDLSVRAAQLYLVYLGFDPGPVDGEFGKKTLSALNAFLSREGQAQVSTLSPAILSLLENRAET